MSHRQTRAAPHQTPNPTVEGRRHQLPESSAPEGAGRQRKTGKSTLTTAMVTIINTTMRAAGDLHTEMEAGGGGRVQTPTRRCQSTSRKMTEVEAVARNKAPELVAEITCACRSLAIQELALQERAWYSQVTTLWTRRLCAQWGQAKPRGRLHLLSLTALLRGAVRDLSPAAP